MSTAQIHSFNCLIIVYFLIVGMCLVEKQGTFFFYIYSFTPQKYN